MASTWSALKIELLETGQNSGQWGNLTNVNLGDAVLGEAITGSATVDFASDADVTITLTDSATSQSARNLRLNITESSTGIGSVRNLILGSGCQIEKFYLINNTGTGAKTVKNTSGTGISVPAGKATLVYNNGTNVVDAASYFTSLTLGSALPVASGGTGITSFGSGVATFLGTPSSANLAAALTDETGSGSAVFATSPTLVTPNLGTPTTLVLSSATGLPLSSGVTGILPVANGGTATATPALVQGSGVTITGTWPNQTINATGTGGTVTSVAVSGGTTGLTTSGGPITTSGTITLAGTVATTNGGTGLTSFTSGGVVYASSTSALATGSALTFDGTNLGVTGTTATIKNTLTATTASVYSQYANTGGTLYIGKENSAGSSFGSNAYATVFYDTGNNPMVFFTSSTERMRLNSTGLGIGTSSPANKLQVEVSSADVEAVLFNNSYTVASARTALRMGYQVAGYGVRIVSEGNAGAAYSNSLVFERGIGSSSYSETMRINASGNVGIGTASPDANLTVNGAASFAAGTALLPSIARAGDLNTGLWFPAADTLAASTGGTERYRVDSSGNFAIGTSSAAGYTLHVSNATPTVRISGTSETAGQVQSLYFGTSTYNRSEIRSINVGTQGADLAFLTSPTGSSSVERMRISSAGDVGIGTSSPSVKLDVIGSTRTSASSSFGYLSGYDYTYIQSNGATGGGSVMATVNFASSAYQPFTQDASLFIWRPSSTEIMRLTSSGLGLGTTTIGTKLDIRGTSNTSASTIQIVGNSVSTLLLGQNADGGVIRGQGGNNALTFWTGGSGDTGAGQSGTERMRLDSAGNVLVGGTAARGTTVGTKHLDLFDGTAPAGTLTNGVSLYSSSGDLKFMNAAGDAFDVGYRNIPQNSQSANYTLTLADAGDHIFHPVGDNNARTFTIPANSSVAYPIGTAITFINMAAANVTIAITTDTMYLSSAGTTGSRTLAQYGSATAIKITSTNWLISGSGLT